MPCEEKRKQGNVIGYLYNRWKKNGMIFNDESKEIPWHVGESNLWMHRMDDPLMEFPKQLAMVMYVHRSHDESIQRNFDLSE